MEAGYPNVVKSIAGPAGVNLVNEFHCQDSSFSCLRFDFLSRPCRPACWIMNRIHVSIAISTPLNSKIRCLRKKILSSQALRRSLELLQFVARGSGARRATLAEELFGLFGIHFNSNSVPV